MCEGKPVDNCHREDSARLYNNGHGYKSNASGYKDDAVGKNKDGLGGKPDPEEPTLPPLALKSLAVRSSISIASYPWPRCLDTVDPLITVVVKKKRLRDHAHGSVLRKLPSLISAPFMLARLQKDIMRVRVQLMGPEEL